MFIGNVSQKSISKVVMSFELLGVFTTLLLALGLQVILHELPCPLCLLQRIGFLSIAFGFLMNLRFGVRPSHYAMALLGALFTSFVALRQIALHVVPGTGTYGSAVFGLHLYTWSFIIAMMILLVTTIILGFDKQYHPEFKQKRWVKQFTYCSFALMVILLLANITSVLMECGISQCPDNPVAYKIL